MTSTPVPHGETGIDALPAMIAVPLDGLEREYQPVIRLWRNCDAAELLARVLVAIGAAKLEDRLPAGHRRERPDDDADLHRLAAVASASEWVAANELVALIADRGYGEEDGLRAVLARVVRKHHV